MAPSHPLYYSVTSPLSFLIFFPFPSVTHTLFPVYLFPLSLSLLIVPFPSRHHTQTHTHKLFPIALFIHMPPLITRSLFPISPYFVPPFIIHPLFFPPPLLSSNTRFPLTLSFLTFSLLLITHTHTFSSPTPPHSLLTFTLTHTYLPSPSFRLSAHAMPIPRKRCRLTCAVSGGESFPLDGCIRLEDHQHLVIRRHDRMRDLFKKEF
jgi:hypothetical protein